MGCSYLVPSSTSDMECNIFANKSSVILHWLLLTSVEKKTFSIREVATKLILSVGLVQKVFSMLVQKGILQTDGYRTSKRFMLKNPFLLLELWKDYYDITEKCKIFSYRSAIQDPKEIFQILTENNLQKNLTLTLHAGADANGYKNSNLNTLEFYLLDENLRKKIEKILLLEPQEKGYEIILIDPYYKELIKRFSQNIEIEKNINFLCSPILLLYLDLYHFPLRGNEQAQFLLQKNKMLQEIFKKRN
jgi:hypothetical protein